MYVLKFCILNFFFIGSNHTLHYTSIVYVTSIRISVNIYAYRKKVITTCSYVITIILICYMLVYVKQCVKVVQLYLCTQERTLVRIISNTLTFFSCVCFVSVKYVTPVLPGKVLYTRRSIHPTQKVDCLRTHTMFFFVLSA